MKRRVIGNLQTEIEVLERVFDEVVIVDPMDRAEYEICDTRMIKSGRCGHNNFCSAKVQGQCLCQQAMEANTSKSILSFKGNELFMVITEGFRYKNRQLVMVLSKRVDKQISFASSTDTEIVDKISEVASTIVKDKLTRVYNRQFLSDKKVLFECTCEKEGKTFNIACIDIDKFKNFNDTYGHEFGDRVLVSVADRMKEICSEMNECYIIRFGGDEFIIIQLGETPDKFAYNMGKLTELIKNTTVKMGTHQAGVAISVGTAEMIKDSADSYEELYEIADERLYKAKNAGRNRVISQ